jgi:hypothetical protein
LQAKGRQGNRNDIVADRPGSSENPKQALDAAAEWVGVGGLGGLGGLSL